MIKIVFLDAKTMGEVPALKELECLGNYTSYPLTIPAERKERASGADIIITCKVIIDKEIIDACPQLRLICVAATGTNNVDVEYAKSKGVEVKNVSGYSNESVAQLTIGVLLSLVNRISYYDQFVKSGEYSRSDMFTHYGPAFYELKGKIAGIIGLGNIGSRVADLLQAFGMNLIYHSVSGKNLSGRYKHVSLSELLETSDVISIHCPLNSLTRNLINKENISRMKPSSILINMARGGIVNETDIVNGLNNELIAGYASDVYEKEPMDSKSPFLRLKNPEKTILTPHIAWASIQARSILIDKLLVNIKTFIDNHLS